jgi:transcriptional regulator with XRE-family HTH domain
MSPGETVKALRLDRRMTQRELSERTGLTQSALSAIEHGVEPLGLARAVRIAEALGVHHRDILGQRPTTVADTSPIKKITKPSQLTDEEWDVAQGRSDCKFLYGDDVRKLLYGEHVPAHRWRRRA